MHFGCHQSLVNVFYVVWYILISILLNFEFSIKTVEELLLALAAVLIMLVYLLLVLMSIREKYQ